MKKINFACGRQTWESFYCIDAKQHPKATRPVDLLHAFVFNRERLLNPLPISAESVEEVHAYHFIEHVYAWEAPAVISEFRRVLVPGGKLILELPNLILACHNLLEGSTDQFSMWPLYGDPGTRDLFNCHRWGYTPKTIKALLVENGMTGVKVGKPETHGRKLNRDMRVTCKK